MLRIYYTIWVDGLLRLKSRPANEGMWKFYGFVFISMAMALNIAFFMAILQRNILGISFYNITFKIFSEEKLNSFLSFFVLFMLVPIIVNYLLIFRNDKYETLFKKYKSYDGKFCATYLMISYFLPLVILIFGYFINKM